MGSPEHSLPSAWSKPLSRFLSPGAARASNRQTFALAGNWRENTCSAFFLRLKVM